MIFIPGALLFFTVLSFNFAGDGLRDAVDPRMKREVTLMEKGNILEIKNLQVTFYTEDGIVRALQGVSYEVPDNETLGLWVSLAVEICYSTDCDAFASQASSSCRRWRNLVKDKETGQEINILEQSEEHMRHIRGNKISMIFQEPMTALNPVYTVGDQIMEAIMVHNPDISKKEARERAIEMLKWLVYQLLKRGWMTIHTKCRVV